MQEDGDAMTEPTEQQPVAVPEGAIRTGEITLRWSWVESSVWTAQMLTALEQGVKGGKWFSLNDKICRAPTLAAALCKVAANQGAEGVDHVTIEMFQERSDENLRRLNEELRNGTGCDPKKR